jgi:integrase
VRDGKNPEIVKKIGNHSFEELRQKYEAWIDGRQKSARIKKYLLKGMSQRFGSLPLRNFTTLLVDQYQTDLIARGLKTASVNKVLNILKHLFSKAVEWEMVEEEVLKKIRKVKPLKGENKRLRYLSQEECRRLVEACDVHLRPIVVTALHTGMRKGEILSLQWKDVDLRHGFIHLDGSMTKNAERRDIPLNQTVRNTLRGLRTRLDVPHVFHVESTGKRYLDIKRSFGTACRKAGITDFHFHDLRHTFASHLVMLGQDLKTVQELLGHKDIKMTLRYSHLAPEHKAKAVDIFDQALTGRAGSVSQAVGQSVEKL